MTRTPALARALGAALGAALLVAACKDSDGPTPRPTPIQGTFDLRSVDGQALPTTVRIAFAGGQDFLVRSGRAAFQGSDQVELSAQGDLPGNPNVSFGLTETYAQPVADSIVIALQGGGRLRGDSLIFHTASVSVLGVHEWRFVRATLR